MSDMDGLRSATPALAGQAKTEPPAAAPDPAELGYMAHNGHSGRVFAVLKQLAPAERRGYATPVILRQAVVGGLDVLRATPAGDPGRRETVALVAELVERQADAAANLENIRRGQYEGLKEEIESNPGRRPDFGPVKLGPAGATVIGARNPLIAFNVYLTTSDVDIAKKIARAVRQSSGGLRYVKGLGMLVEGRAQVSMNLTNFRETPMARVVELIPREAERYGVAIHHSELVGLIPQDALTDAAVWYMQMDQFDKAQVLEGRLFEAHASTPAENGPSFIEELAAPTPTPGGGSAAAYAGAMGAGLVAMVAGLTIGKKKYADVEAEM